MPSRAQCGCVAGLRFGPWQSTDYSEMCRGRILQSSSLRMKCHRLIDVSNMSFAVGSKGWKERLQTDVIAALLLIAVSMHLSLDPCIPEYLRS